MRSNVRSDLQKVWLCSRLTLMPQETSIEIPVRHTYIYTRYTIMFVLHIKQFFIPVHIQQHSVRAGSSSCDREIQALWWTATTQQGYHYAHLPCVRSIHGGVYICSMAYIYRYIILYSYTWYIILLYIIIYILLIYTWYWGSSRSWRELHTSPPETDFCLKNCVHTACPFRTALLLPFGRHFGTNCLKLLIESLRIHVSGQCSNSTRTTNHYIVAYYYCR